jgi:hypothetical protein
MGESKVQERKRMSIDTQPGSVTINLLPIADTATFMTALMDLYNQHATPQLPANPEKANNVEGSGDLVTE